LQRARSASAAPGEILLCSPLPDIVTPIGLADIRLRVESQTLESGDWSIMRIGLTRDWGRTHPKRG